MLTSKSVSTPCIQRVSVLSHPIPYPFSSFQESLSSSDEQSFAISFSNNHWRLALILFWGIFDCFLFLFFLVSIAMGIEYDCKNTKKWNNQTLKPTMGFHCFAWHSLSQKARSVSKSGVVPSSMFSHSTLGQIVSQKIKTLDTFCPYLFFILPTKQ